MQAQARNFLESFANKNPAGVGERVQQLAALYDKKLWHNVTTTLVELVEMPEMKGSARLIPLYNEFIKTFESKINQLTLAKLIIAVSEAYTDTNEAIQFIEAAATRLAAVEGNEEPYLLLSAVLVQLKLKDPENLYDCKQRLESIQTALDRTSGVDSAIYSNHYRAQADYYKLKGQPTEYYKNALLFLAYTPLETLTDEKKREIAYDLGLSALVGEDIFNFGDLLAHPIVDSLEGTDKEWLAHLLRAFNRGDNAKYEELVARYHNQLSGEPALLSAADLLKEKMAILALIELMFERQAISRDVSFADIAERTKLPLDTVELLVMRALSVNLIKGKIDQVEQVVRVHWVQPRVLGLDQLAKMRDMLDIWTKKVHSTLVFVEQGTPDLFS